MRLAIADDSGLFRSSLKLLLEASGAQVTASAASGTELLAAIEPDLPDAVLLDIRMPPSFTDEGITTAGELRRRYPRVGILVLSTYAETSYASRLLETVSTGVGYLLKDNVTDAGALMGTLARVADGETVIDPAIVRRLLHRNRTPNLMDALNERERAVLEQMAEGRSNLGIAQQLFLSPRTVETHVSNVFTKLGLDQRDTDNNRVRAVLAFLRSAALLGGREEGQRPPAKPSPPARLVPPPSSFENDHVVARERVGQVLAEPFGDEVGDDDGTAVPARVVREAHLDVNRIAMRLAGNGRGGCRWHCLPRIENRHHDLSHPERFYSLPVLRCLPIANRGIANRGIGGGRHVWQSARSECSPGSWKVPEISRDFPLDMV